MRYFETNSISRLSWLGKEKDSESNLGDHGVRKYSNETGKFLSVDPLWENYLGFTAYQYAGNNPVNNIDVNGLWVQEIAKESHRHNGPISKNSNGYLADKINNQFYSNWTTTAPAVASFVANNNLFAMQGELPKGNPANGEVGGNLSTFDLSQTESSKELEGNTLHEIVHNMGHGEFGAYGAMIAAGYQTANDIASLIEGNSSVEAGIFTGRKDLHKKWLTKKLSTMQIVDMMDARGMEIIKSDNTIKNK